MEANAIEQALLHRTALLLGDKAVKEISSKRVIIFGVGGVGSWCAESLVRTGIKHLTIVDSDCVCATNCNRQLMATSKTIDRVKVGAMKERLLEINPNAEIVAVQRIYQAEEAESFHLEQYDYVIDAIDSLKDKAHLILHATELSRKIKRGELTGEGIAMRLTFFSSMGAALRIDPTKIRVSEFWKVKNDNLARALRNRFKRNKQAPAMKFQCVYSEEPPMQNQGENRPLATAAVSFQKAQTNGSLSHITAIFGFTIAGLVIQDITKKEQVLDIK